MCRPWSPRSSPVLTPAVTLDRSTTSTTPARSRAAPTPPARNVSIGAAYAGAGTLSIAMEALRAVVDWPVTAAGAVVVGAGPDSWATRRRGDEGRTYPWASVTKLCTAWAVLVAVEEGRVLLDDPQVPPGSTLAHLLSHASGLAPDYDQVLWPPARRRVYSNRG